MNRILEIGFRNVGRWELVDGNLIYKLTSLMNNKNILYAFISDDQIKYIGKTTQPLKKRMYGYKNPGPTQSTNIRNNANIKSLLSEGKQVDIFALPDNGLLHYGAFHLNLAAGLEDNLIAKIQPEWNSVRSVITAADKPVEDNRKNLTIEVDSLLTVINDDNSRVYERTIAETYYDQGFFNVSVGFEKYFGDDRSIIEIYLAETDVVLYGLIDRTANKNGTPRIRGAKGLKDWFQGNFKVLDTMYIVILSKNSIKIGKFLDNSYSNK